MKIKTLQFWPGKFLIPRRMKGDIIIHIHMNVLPKNIKHISDAILFADDISMLENADNYRESKS